MGDTAKMWVDRVPRFVNTQRDGIDTWTTRQRVKVTILVDAYMEIFDISDERGQDVGRRVEFYMKGEHMATLIYGPPREGFIFKKKRQLVKTQYHV